MKSMYMIKPLVVVASMLLALPAFSNGSAQTSGKDKVEETIIIGKIIIRTRLHLSGTGLLTTLETWRHTSSSTMR